MIQDGPGQQQGYGPSSTGRPVAIQPYGSPPAVGVDTLPPHAMGDHSRPQTPPSVIVQRTQMHVSGLDLTSRSPEREALRSEVAYLHNQIEQTRIYAQMYNDEQKRRLLEEAQSALASQREGFLRTSERYEQEARDVARQ